MWRESSISARIAMLAGLSILCGLTIAASPSAHGDPASEIEAGSGGSFRDCLACPEMVVVPAGKFLMGSPDEEAERENWKEGTESPQIEVNIRRLFATARRTR